MPTPIAWTDETWNPTRGCSRVNKDCGGEPGQGKCYAIGQAHRFSGPGGAYEGLTRIGKHGPDWSGVVRLVPEMLDQPLRWRKPRRIFVDSMSDLFHPALKNEEIAAVFGVMAKAYWHCFQILTKRPARILEFLEWARHGTRVWEAGQKIEMTDAQLRAHHNPVTGWPLPNVWLGVSAGHQAALDEFVPLLLRCPAALRWVSIEPQTEEVDLGSLLGCMFHGRTTPACVCDRIGWIVQGGESGPGARPFDLSWARKTRDQCKAAGVPWFLKQLGAAPFDIGEYPTGRVPIRDRGGKDPSEWPEDLRVQDFPTVRS